MLHSDFFKPYSSSIQSLTFMLYFPNFKCVLCNILCRLPLQSKHSVSQTRNSSVMTNGNRISQSTYIHCCFSDFFFFEWFRVQFQKVCFSFLTDEKNELNDESLKMFHWSLRIAIKVLSGVLSWCKGIFDVSSHSFFEILPRGTYMWSCLQGAYQLR